jgi:phospholipid/cholesterol/gamma-HCH transport system substrate-binding protein
MSTERKGAEIYVGIFLVTGLTFIALMLVRFGGIAQSFSNYYSITVEFDNASGIIKDSVVLLAGAPIGKVAEKPKLLIRDGFGVSVKLNIAEDVRIPRDATIVVDQSGLLGDCYVDVIPPAKIDKTNLIQPGDTIVGGTKPGLGALQQQGTTALGKLADTLDELKKITGDLHTGLLNEQNLKNLSDTFANLKTTTDNLSVSSKKLDGILDKGDGAVESAKKTFESADKAAADLRTAMADFKRVAESANKTMDSARNFVDTGTRVLKKAEQGEGALGLLLTDKETADNLKAFSANLRRSGPVFYKDKEPRQPAPTPPPKRR